MTTQERVTSLMDECLGDATKIVRESSVWTTDTTIFAAATLAAAMFTARWKMGEIEEAAHPLLRKGTVPDGVIRAVER